WTVAVAARCGSLASASGGRADDVAKPGAADVAKPGADDVAKPGADVAKPGATGDASTVFAAADGGARASQAPLAGAALHRRIAPCRRDCALLRDRLRARRGHRRSRDSLTSGWRARAHGQRAHARWMTCGSIDPFEPSAKYDAAVDVPARTFTSVARESSRRVP